jgi:tetratricopeptide (TPR) repeat protein
VSFSDFLKSSSGLPQEVVFLFFGILPDHPSKPNTRLKRLNAPANWCGHRRTNDHTPQPLFNMQKFLTNKLTLLLCAALVSTSLVAQVTTPRNPSPAASVTQTIGISTVTVSYSRPSVKGRAIWGAQVPYGWNVQGFGLGNSAPWRAGANENTVIQFSHPAKFAGQAVPAGSYGLFFTINSDNTTGEVILSKDYRSWGSFFYDQAHDQLRAKITLRDNAMTEMLTYDFINSDKNSSELVLNWEKKQFPVKIEFAVDEIVMANATEQLKSTVGFNPAGVTSAANYALANKVNQEQGLIWIDKALAQNNSFANLSTKAGLLKQLGKTAEADKIMTDALAVANEAELNTYGYQLLANGDNDKAVEILALATKKNPTSANAWDSLGEAYATKGDKKNAIASFKKSLTLNPPVGTKANSEKFLKQLGAM